MIVSSELKVQGKSKQAEVKAEVNGSTRVCDSDVSHGRSPQNWLDRAEFQKYLRTPCCVTPGTPPRMSREWLGHVEDRQQEECAGWLCKISAVLADNPVVLAANHIICCHLPPQMCKSASTIVLVPRWKQWKDTVRAPD